LKLVYETKGHSKIKDKRGAKRRRNHLNLTLIPLVMVLAAMTGFIVWQSLGGKSTDEPEPVGFVSAKPAPKIGTSPIGTIVLGRPTDKSITANIMPDKNWEVVLQYGTKPGQFTEVTVPYKAEGGPIMAVINDLKPDTQYYYRMGYRTSNEQPYQTGPEYKFHTARAKGDSFTFAIQSDSHFDINSADLYKVTANNILNSNPDFLIDLGDKLMTTAYAKSYTDTQNKYSKVRYFMSWAGSSTPVFLANGNHDAENGWLNKNSNNVAIWSTQVRKLLFPNPAPNNFYSGDQTALPGVGLRNSYYSWEWGDALFVVLDPFWNTKKLSSTLDNNDLWSITIGDEQYAWLNKTLSASNARYKFVFSHHILGASPHGGIYWTQFGEWGGKNLNGSWGFNTKRSGWDLPITKVLEKYKVSAFFQGHDHIFGKEDQGGVVYQEVPQPNSPYGQSWLSKKFPYNGVTLPSSGYLRVTVSGRDATVDYIKSYTSTMETKNQHNADVPFSYTIYPR